MTTEVEVRNGIVALLNPAWVTAYPGVKIFYENTVQVSLDDVGDRFTTASIDFTDSVRQGIDESPITGSYGVITMRLFSKEGTGVNSTLEEATFLRNLLKYKKLAGVTLDCPRMGKKVAKDGWVSQDLIVPFQFWQ